MKDWERDKHWSDQFIPEIKRVLGEFLICEAPAIEDRERGTDLIVMTMAAIQIACRIRKTDPYFLRYPNEFTVRAVRGSGNKTELAKFIEGFGHFMFYGFGASDGRLTSWMIGNLNVFRLWFNSELARNCGKPPGVLKKNSDGSSDFYAFDVRALPQEFVHARFLPETARISKLDQVENSIPPPAACPQCNTQPAVKPCPVCDNKTQRQALEAIPKLNRDGHVVPPKEIELKLF